MGARDLPDMYALSPQAYISGKSLAPMLQLLLVTYDSLSHRQNGYRWPGLDLLLFPDA